MGVSIEETELDFKITSEIGFSEGELDFYLSPEEGASPVDVLDKADIPDRPASRVGDCYQLGRHKLLCGDARKTQSYVRLLGGSLADLVITDVPYNVPIAGHVSGLGRQAHREFVMASGELSRTEFHDLLRSSLGAMVQTSKSGAVHYIFIDWRHIQELQEATQGLYSELLNICVWNKTNGGMGSLYRSKHELILVQKVGSAPHTNNVELGSNGRYRSNVWDYPGNSSFGSKRADALAMHPTVKPVALVADAIQDCSRRGETVLDGFCGSGTTLLAAERTHRIACGIELDPGYVDITLNRWMRVTGQTPVLMPDNIPWPEVREQRRGEAQKNGTVDRLRAGGRS